MTRVPDEVCGLPPLADVDHDIAMLVQDWTATVGIVAVDDHAPIPVRFLSVRGLVRSAEAAGGVEWAQAHIAVPVEHAVDVAAALAKGTSEDL